MNRVARVVLAALAAAGFLVLTAAPAGAHASLLGSAPAGGSALETAPTEVKITFTEPPDPVLSSVEVVGKSGPVQKGKAALVPGDEMSLTTSLREVPNGSYTVTWRTVSTADGHASTGSFVFGVGEPPSPAAAGAPATPAFNKLGAAGRWIFYLGLMALVGTASTALYAFRKGSTALLNLSVMAWVTTVVGLLVIGLSQWVDSEVGTRVFLGSSSGRSLQHRAIPLVVGGLGFLLLRSNATRAIAVAGLAGLATMFAHASAGHAAVDPSKGIKIAEQIFHMATVGVWIGGLAALLVGIRGEPDGEKAIAVRRFSTIAGVAIFLVAATGVLRAVNEVGSWSQLFDSSYGKLVVAKALLIGVLGLLGALNRFRHVPRAATSTAGLHKTGMRELGVAVATLAVAGVLASSIPPASIAATTAAGPATVSGTNFAGTVQASLTVSPGTAGPNLFTLKLRDGSGKALDAEDVVLRFTSLSHPEVAASTLPLERRSAGVYEKAAGNLSSDGRWRLNAAGRRGTDTFDIALELSTRADGYTEDKVATPGQPSIYKITDTQQRQLQVYADPEKPGRAEFHTTFFAPDGMELPVDSVSVIAVVPRGGSASLPTRRFGPGHFVSDIDLTAGKFRFDVVATTQAGPIRFLSSVEIPK